MCVRVLLVSGGVPGSSRGGVYAVHAQHVRNKGSQPDLMLPLAVKTTRRGVCAVHAQHVKNKGSQPDLKLPLPVKTGGGAWLLSPGRVRLACAACQK